MASAVAATGSTAGSTTTAADPTVHPLNFQLDAMEAELQRVQITIETERRAGSEFRQSIADTISRVRTATVTPAQPPLSPAPAPPRF